MSNTASPTLNLFVNAAPGLESASATADGTRSAIVARKSSPACNRALTRLYSCVWYLMPPRRKAAPSMNKLLVTIAPAMDAFTSIVWPARNAASAMTNSVRFPSVAFEQAADRIARLGRHRLGGMTQQHGQWHDREDRQQKEQCVCFGPDLPGDEHDGHKGQQPEQWIVTDFFQQSYHRFRWSGHFPGLGQRLLRRRRGTIPWTNPTSARPSPLRRHHRNATPSP